MDSDEPPSESIGETDFLSDTIRVGNHKGTNVVCNLAPPHVLKKAHSI